MPAANYPSGKYYTAKAPCLQCNQRIRRQGYPSTVANKRYCSIACRDLHRSQGFTRECRRCLQRKPWTRFQMRNGRPSGTVCSTCYAADRKARLNKEPYGAQWRNYRTRCAHKKPEPIPFTIERDEFTAILNNACHYCGTTAVPRGLDRIDTDDAVGYTLTNVVPACLTCNRMRMHLPYDAFKAHVAQIAQQHATPPRVYIHPEGLHPWVKASSGSKPGAHNRHEATP